MDTVVKVFGGIALLVGFVVSEGIAHFVERMVAALASIAT